MSLASKRLNIKDAEVYQLARKLSDLTGESLTEVVRHSLQERLRRERQIQADPLWLEPLCEISDRCAARPVIDPRSDDQLVGYSEHGLAAI